VSASVMAITPQVINSPEWTHCLKRLLLVSKNVKLNKCCLKIDPRGNTSSVSGAYAREYNNYTYPRTPMGGRRGKQ
jgi:hypothetical protein